MTRQPVERYADADILELMEDAAASVGKKADALYAFIVERRPDAFLGSLRVSVRTAIYRYTGKYPNDPEREECLVHDPPCRRGDDGAWHPPADTPIDAIATEDPNENPYLDPEYRARLDDSDPNVGPCAVCGKPLRVGEWGCISRVVDHVPSVQTNTFAAYFDVGLGIQVNNLGDRNAAMRGHIDVDTGTKVGQLDYREKMSKGDLSARNDRIHERLQKQERARRG